MLAQVNTYQLYLQGLVAQRETIYHRLPAKLFSPLQVGVGLQDIAWRGLEMIADVIGAVVVYAQQLYAPVLGGGTARQV